MNLPTDLLNLQFHLSAVAHLFGIHQAAFSTLRSIRVIAFYAMQNSQKHLSRCVKASHYIAFLPTGSTSSGSLASAIESETRQCSMATAMCGCRSTLYSRLHIEFRDGVLRFDCVRVKVTINLDVTRHSTRPPRRAFFPARHLFSGPVGHAASLTALHASPRPRVSGTNTLSCQAIFSMNRKQKLYAMPLNCAISMWGNKRLAKRFSAPSCALRLYVLSSGTPAQLPYRAISLVGHRFPGPLHPST